jgi:hypothetical protein
MESVTYLEIEMKKFIALVLLTLVSIPSFAQHFHYGHHYGPRYWSPGYGWVAPAIVGGVIGYELSRQPVFVQQPPVIVQQPSVVVQQPAQNCSPWTETQNPDGTITRTRTCAQ